MTAPPRISAITLDAWRYYRASEDMPLDQLVTQLRRHEGHGVLPC